MTLLIRTDDPGATESEYKAQGWKTESLYAKPFYPALCNPDLDGGKLWAMSFWKAEPPQQPELFGS